MSDLDALSREVAAAGDEWITAGVEAIQDGTLLRICVIDRPGDPGTLHGMNLYGCVVRWQKGADMRPNLADPVTVNALLGNGQAWRRIIGGGVAWVASVDLVHERTEDDRTTAICRAWIAAHKEKGNG